MQFERIVFNGPLAKLETLILLALLIWVVSILIIIYYKYFTAMREIRIFRKKWCTKEVEINSPNPYEAKKYSRRKYQLAKLILGTLWDLKCSTELAKDLYLSKNKLEHIDGQVKKIFYKKRYIAQFILLFSILIGIWGIAGILFILIRGFSLILDELSTHTALQTLFNYIIDMKPILVLAYLNILLSTWIIISSKALAQFIFFEISDLQGTLYKK